MGRRICFHFLEIERFARLHAGDKVGLDLEGVILTYFLSGFDQPKVDREVVGDPS